MKIETNSEHTERLIREHADRHVPGRTLLRGYQWNGIDVPGRGTAATRRLKQQATQRAKAERKALLMDGDVITIDKDQFGRPVLELDPVTRTPTGRLKQFVVTKGWSDDA